MVVQRDQEGVQEVPIARWTGDMLVIAAVRSAANDGALDASGAERVLARLGADSPFSLSDLPY